MTATRATTNAQVPLVAGGTGAPTAAGARTNLGLGTLATQSGTFSGTSSGTNTGDQTVPAFATPAVVLGTAAAAGAASTVIRSDGTIAAFDATVPTTQAFGDAAATGSAAFAARRDHLHAMPSSTLTRSFFLNIPMGTTDAGTVTTQGTLPDRSAVDNLADAATNGHYWTFRVPGDWVSGALTVQAVWGPSATDASAHTVAWSMDCKELAAGIDISTAGTTVAFTGSSAVRTIRQVVYDTATSTTVTPSAAGNLFMLNLRRVGADAADTYVGVVQLLGVIVSYTASRSL